MKITKHYKDLKVQIVILKQIKINIKNIYHQKIIQIIKIIIIKIKNHLIIHLKQIIFINKNRLKIMIKLNK